MACFLNSSINFFKKNYAKRFAHWTVCIDFARSTLIIADARNPGSHACDPNIFKLRGCSKVSLTKRKCASGIYSESPTSALFSAVHFRSQTRLTYWKNGKKGWVNIRWCFWWRF